MRSHRLGELLTVLALALLPVFSGFGQLALSLPPPPFQLLRAAFIVGGLAAALLIVGSAIGRDTRRAATALGFGFFVFSLYPTVRRILLLAGVESHDRL